MEYLQFKVENQECGINIEDVIAIEETGRITTIPTAKSVFKGIKTIRNQVVPVYDLRKKLNIKGAASATSQLVVTYASSEKTEMIAFEVDKVEGIIHAGKEDFFELPNIIRNENTSYIKNICHTGGKLLLVIDTYGILTEEEREEAKNIALDGKGNASGN